MRAGHAFTFTRGHGLAVAIVVSYLGHALTPAGAQHVIPRQVEGGVYSQGFFWIDDPAAKKHLAHGIDGYLGHVVGSHAAGAVHGAFKGAAHVCKACVGTAGYGLGVAAGHGADKLGKLAGLGCGHCGAPLGKCAHTLGFSKTGCFSVECHNKGVCLDKTGCLSVECHNTGGCVEKTGHGHGMAGHGHGMVGHGHGIPGHGLGHGMMGHGPGLFGGHGGFGPGGHGHGLGVGLFKAGHKNDGYFVGPGGPIPLSPAMGAGAGYVNPVRAPRDFFAFPPFTENSPY